MKMLSSSDVQRLAAAKALEWGEGKGAIASVKVDGASVALADAKATLDEVKRQVAPEPSLVDRWAGTLDAKVKTLEEKLASKPMAKKVLDVLATDQERVATKVQVDVAFEDGHSEKLTVEVVDIATTKLLNELTAAAELASLTPLVGTAITALAAVSAHAGAKLSEWSGRAELAQALQKAALKQWVLAGVGFVPGLGTASGLMSAARDLKDKAAVQAGPAVSVIA